MALVLTRWPGEQVRFLLPDGREAVLTLLSADGRGRVRLDLDAPADVAIQRPEADHYRLTGPEQAEALRRFRENALTPQQQGQTAHE